MRACAEEEYGKGGREGGGMGSERGEIGGGQGGRWGARGEVGSERGGEERGEVGSESGADGARLVSSVDFVLLGNSPPSPRAR